MNQNELFNPADCGLFHNHNNNDDPYFGEKIEHEIHRIMGLLRFSPDEDGVYTAKCAPDYFLLPALEQHFTERFGDTPWKIIDEKRGLSLSRKNGSKPILQKLEQPIHECRNAPALTDEWEELWKHYHKTINNESRDNPRLQRQLMPQKYWKYLPEKDL